MSDPAGTPNTAPLFHIAVFDQLPDDIAQRNAIL